MTAISPIINIQLVDQANVANYLDENQQNLLKFKGQYKKNVFLTDTSTLLVGIDFEKKIKTSDPFYVFNAYELGADCIKAIKKMEYSKLVIKHHPILTDSQNLFLFSLGIYQASWQFDKYKSIEKLGKKFEIELDSSLAPLPLELDIFNQGMDFARNLMEEMPEVLNPQSIAKIVTDEFSEDNQLELDIIDKQRLEKMQMGAILGVSQGSKFDPCLVHIIVKPKNSVKKRICLVGKGLTFDSGGLDVKINGLMLGMKYDMAGAGTMLGVAKILKDLQKQDLGLLNTEVHIIAGFVENAVDAKSYRPGDVLTSYSGISIEVFNTDAEGRITLADTLAFATMQDPDYIVEASTLTGAVIAAYGYGTAAIMGNDANLEKQVYNSFVNQLEPAQQMQLSEKSREQFIENAEIGDIVNLAYGYKGGAMTAGVFLTTFVDQNNWTSPTLKEELKTKGKEPKAYPFVHLDIAGSASNNKINQLGHNGSTGHGIRSITRWIQNIDKN